MSSPIDTPCELGKRLTLRELIVGVERLTTLASQRPLNGIGTTAGQHDQLVSAIKQFPRLRPFEPPVELELPQFR